MRVEEPPPGNHLFYTGQVTHLRGRGRFTSSPPSRQSPSRSNRSSPLSVPPLSTTPRNRRMKSPAPETTPTRLRKEITMTTGASPSILGSQRSRKVPSFMEVPDAPTPTATLTSDEIASVEPTEKPTNIPAVTVDMASPAAPTNVSQASVERPLIRQSPQLDPYYPYAGASSYTEEGAAPPPSRYPSYDPYFSHPPPLYPPGAGLNPYMRLPSPAGEFMRGTSPSGGWLPQRPGPGLGRGDYNFMDSEISSPSDWMSSDAGPGYREPRQQTPIFPRPPLPPKPLGLQPPVGVGSSNPPIPPPPNNPTFTPMSLDLSHHKPPTTSTVQSASEARETPAVIPQADTREAPGVIPQSDTHEAPGVETQDVAGGPPTIAPLDRIATSPVGSSRSSPGAPTTLSPNSARAGGGRPTTKALVLIDDAFQKITKIIEGLAESTGKPASDLYRRLERSRKGPSDGHLWNIYQHYFSRHEQEEADRIGEPILRTQRFRSRCYKLYKEQTPNFEELLMTYHELEMATAEMTVGQRKKEFEKYEKKMQDLALEAYRTFDVDTFFITAGSIVLSDHGLVSFFETPNAKGYLADKVDIQPTEASAAFSAHIYNQKATDALAFTREMKTPSPIIKAEQPLPSLPSGENPSHGWLMLIKQKIFELFQVYGIPISLTQFPWKQLLFLLAKHGLILSGYPLILMPGEVRGSNKTKAIGDLISTEQVALATALGLNGQTDYKITLKRVAKTNLDALQAGEVAVIVGRPPPAGSSHSRGYQAYYDINKKTPSYRWDGLPRLTVSKTSLKSAATQVDDDVVIITSSPPASIQDERNSEAGTSGVAKPSKRASSKRKVVIDSPSSSDDDLFIDDPKPKRQKSCLKGGGRDGKNQEVGTKGKGKVAGAARIKRARNTVKSAAVIEDTTDPSNDEGPPARPKPRPAYSGTNNSKTPTAPQPRSPKDTPPTEPSITIAQPVASATDPTCDAPRPLPLPARDAPRSGPVAAAAPNCEPVHPEAHRPPVDYQAHATQYHHREPLGYGSRPPAVAYQRYPGEVEATDRYGFRSNHFGYGPPHHEYGPPREYTLPPREYAPPSREYYGQSYPPTAHSHPHGAAYRHSHHESHLQPNTTGPGGLPGNAVPSSSRLSPTDRHL